MDGRFFTVAEPHCVVALPGKANKNRNYDLQKGHHPVWYKAQKRI
jgi:hypothetical protein